MAPTRRAWCASLLAAASLAGLSLPAQADGLDSLEAFLRTARSGRTEDHVIAGERQCRERREAIAWLRVPRLVSLAGHRVSDPDRVRVAALERRVRGLHRSFDAQGRATTIAAERT